MNIIVDRPQLVRVVNLYLTKNFEDLILKTSKDYPYSVFYVNSDNDILMKYDEKTEKIWIDYGQIWSKLESFFSLQYGDIQSIMRVWLEKHYGLSEVTPHTKFSRNHYRLEEHYKSSNL
jgi:hypothetical protein